MDFFGNFVDILLWSLWLSIWFMFIFLLIKFIFDVWRDEGIGVGAKIGWTLLLVVFEIIGALIYLFVRGKGMAERDMARARDYRAAEVEYTRSLMYDDDAIDTLKSKGPAGEISQAKALLDAGAITPEEFEKLKARALA